MCISLYLTSTGKKMPGGLWPFTCPEGEAALPVCVDVAVRGNSPAAIKKFNLFA